MTILFHPLARLDIFEISDWYALEQNGLDEQFELQIQSTLKRAVDAPFASRKVYGQFRRIKMRVFPYHIYFVAAKDTLIAVCVVHTSRSPRWIQKTLRKRK